MILYWTANWEVWSGAYYVEGLQNRNDEILKDNGFTAAVITT